MPRTYPDTDVQRAWDPDPLRENWPTGYDGALFFDRLSFMPVSLTATGAGGRVLEVAAAEALHSCRLAQQGHECFVVEPAERMLARARGHMTTHGVRVDLVRGIGEALPFPDGTFDRVLCDSALDHFAEPDLGVREMARVLRPHGRFVISFVNYGSLSVRLSRLLYRLDRAHAPATPEARRFWDTPVPYEHSFECTYRNILELCGQYLELERVVGVSMLYGVPGWSALLERLGEHRARLVVGRLDEAARRVPALADALFTVWRPRRDDEPPGQGIALLPRLSKLGAPRTVAPPPRLSTMRTSPADPIYRVRAAAALDFTARWRWSAGVTSKWLAAQRRENQEVTGDPTRSWLDDLAARGPFRCVAALGHSMWSATWLETGAGRRTDLFDPSRFALRRLRRKLLRWSNQVHLARADLNFLRLPNEHYDLVWSDGALGHVVNLEYVLDEIAQALRPNGMLAYHGYVGERRQQFSPARLERVNAALREVPARYRIGAVETIESTPLGLMSPMEAVRSDEILPLVKARFDLVHETRTGALFPLLRHLDSTALARDAPEILARLDALELEARGDPAVPPAMVYAVFRRRA